MIAIISITKKGDEIADNIQRSIGGDVFKKSKNNNFKLDNIIEFVFKNYKSIVFVSSTGIAVRAIAKYLKEKDIDPAIVVVDVCNKFTISLVSGHLGGANTLTNKIAGTLKNTPVITTATDNLGIEAPDIIALNNNLIIDDLKIAKVIASRLVNNEEVYFIDEKKIITCPSGYKETSEIKNNTVWITNKAATNLTDNIKYKEDESNKTNSFKDLNILKLIRKDVVLGIGCKRNTESEKMHDFVFKTLIENNIDIRAIKTIASIDIKSDEQAILNLSKVLNSKLKFFTKEEIATVHSKFEGSDFVEKIIGVRAVSEPVVELLGAKLYKQKIRKDGMTLSIGFSKEKM